MSGVGGGDGGGRSGEIGEEGGGEGFASADSGSLRGPSLVIVTPRELTPERDSGTGIPGTAVVFDSADLRNLGENINQSSNPESSAAVGASVASQDSDQSSGESQQKRRKLSKPPRKEKFVSAQFIEDYSARRQCASGTGSSLERQIRRYQIKTGAQVFFKAYFPFRGSGGAKFQVGEDFRMPDDPNTSNIKDFQEAALQTIADSVTSVLRDRRLTSVPQTSSASPVFSPQKTVPDTLDKNKCGICKNHDVVESFLKYDSAWIGCQFPGCNKWFHVDCVGFPGATPDKVKSMPPFFCNEHRQYGRMQSGNLPMSYTDGPSSSGARVQETTSQPTKRGRGRRPK